VQETLAKQGKYADAQATKLKADQLEAWEKAKIENELQVVYATKELQMKRAQARELEALQKRIQRGRDEHKVSAGGADTGRTQSGRSTEGPRAERGRVGGRPGERED
jgi:dephospho-CoA kinase